MMIKDSRQMEPLAREATALLKSLAHPDRLMICCQLRAGEMSVGTLETLLDIPQPRLSRELAKLRDEKILAARREGKIVHYSLIDDRAHALVDAICHVMLGPDADHAVRIQTQANKEAAK
ncbi:MAG: metalloregulator ArsR/SmtB family transcription factor [Henriciella sp.]|uniref:metalloregulator ArsR/SmtB family transcription factor n=1 Tax=Henriciella sp. TaxID=1968823 RepID=UPI003C7403EA